MGPKLEKGALGSEGDSDLSESHREGVFGKSHLLLKIKGA